jgi:hypothetical protein
MHRRHGGEKEVKSQKLKIKSEGEVGVKEVDRWT